MHIACTYSPPLYFCWGSGAPFTCTPEEFRVVTSTGKRIASKGIQTRDSGALLFFWLAHNKYDHRLWWRKLARPGLYIGPSFAILSLSSLKHEHYCQVLNLVAPTQRAAPRCGLTARAVQYTDSSWLQLGAQLISVTHGVVDYEGDLGGTFAHLTGTGQCLTL